MATQGTEHAVRTPSRHVAAILSAGLALGTMVPAIRHIPHAEAALVPPGGLYDIRDLGVGAAMALNDDGDVVGSLGNGHGFLHRAGVTTDIGDPAAFAVSENGAAWGLGRGTGAGGSALSVTPDGKTVGGSVLYAPAPPVTDPPTPPIPPRSVPGIWQAGTWHPLFEDGCQFPQLLGGGAYAINNDGVLAGQAVLGTLNAARGIAFTCQPDAGNPGHYFATNLSPFAGPNTGAFGINRRGLIVGKSQSLTGPIQAAMWDPENGDFENGLGLYPSTYVPATNELVQSAAYGVNDGGDIVGTFGPVATAPNLQVGATQNFAFISTDTGGMQDLNKLVASNSGWVFREAFDINNRGQIVGQGTFNGQLHAFLLTPRGTVNAIAKNIVVTQVIQNERNLDLLVAKKATYALVRVQTDGADVPNLTGVLRASRNGVPIGAVTPINAPITAKHDLDLTNPDRSLIFKLDPAWTDEGNLQLEAEINPNFAIQETNYNDNRSFASVQFRSEPSVKVVVVQPWFQGTPTPHFNQAAYDKARELVQAFLPSGDVQFSHRPLTLSIEPPTHPPSQGTKRCGDVISELRKIRGEMDLPTDTLLFGQLDLQDGQMPFGPETNGCAHVPDNVATGFTGAGGDQTAVHELIHAIGRHHVPYCNARGRDIIGYPASTGDALIKDGSLHQSVYPLPEGRDIGFDPRRDTMRPDASDIMTYCRTRWISDYTYENTADLLGRIGLGLLPRIALGFPNNVFSWVASWDILNDSVQADATISDEPAGTELRMPDPGPYHLEFYAGANKVGDVPFDLTPMGPHATEGSEYPLAEVHLRVPLPPGTDHYRVFDAAANREVSVNAINGVAPTVNITSPATGDTLPSAGPVTIQWSSQDDDGDALTHSVLYRAGTSGPWNELARDVTGPSVTVDASEFAGSDAGQVRVIANDGIHATRADVTGLHVAAQAPLVTIDAPTDGASFNTDQSISLSGAAEAAGGGDLTGARYEWVSDRDGLLGSGRDLVVGPLSAGTHHIELRLTSGGVVGTASTTIVVGAIDDLPARLTTSTDDLAFFQSPTAPNTGTFDVYDPNGKSVPFTAQSDDPRVAVDTKSGTTPATIGVTVDMSQLGGGQSFDAHITFTRADGQPGSATVAVNAQSSLGNAEIDPTDIDFQRQAQGATSAPRTITFTHHGPGATTLGAASLAGPSPTDYTLSDDHCTNATLADGQSCTVAVAFRPTRMHRANAYLVLPDSDSEAQWYTSLTGLGGRQQAQADGGLLAWGDDHYGQAGQNPSLGPNNCQCVILPSAVPGLTNVVDAQVGDIAAVAATSDGHVWTWGQNCVGSLGIGTTDCTNFVHPTPVQVPNLSGVVKVAAGYGHALALRDDGTVVGWGDNSGGAIGGTGQTAVKSPFAMVNFTNVADIAAGTVTIPSPTRGDVDQGTSVALRTDGTVYTQDPGSGPVLKADLTPLTEVVAIAPFMALRADGTVWTWAYGAHGERGDGTRVDPSGSSEQNFRIATPVLKLDGSGPLTDVVEVASYRRERYALLQDGTLLAWGYGSSLGTGAMPTDGYALPTPVVGTDGATPLTDVTTIAAGVAARRDGSVVAWGIGGQGAFGDGTYQVSQWGTAVPPLYPRQVKAPNGASYLTGVARLVGGGTRLALTAGAGPTALSAGAPVTGTTTAGATFDETIANFDDSSPSATSSDFTADVDWGDGTHSSAVTISGSTGGSFVVHGVHSYAVPGPYQLSVDVTKQGSDSITLPGTVNVTNVTLAAEPPFDATFTAGASSHQALAAFDDPNPASTASAFTATIDWGDGSAVEPASVAGAPSGPFTIEGDHAYTRAGTYPLVLHVADQYGAQLTLPGRAVVRSAALDIDAMFSSDLGAGRIFNGPVAEIRDGNPLSSPTDYHALIDWGDGSQSAGDVSGPSGGPYLVTGSHTYADAQPYTVKVFITGPEDARAEGSTTLQFPLPKLSLTTSASPTAGVAPVTSSFTYKARNDGPEPLANVVVGDDTCGAGPYVSGDNGNGVLDPAEQWTFTCTHTFTTPGSYVDTSWATAFGVTSALDVRSGNVPTTVTATQVTTITRNPLGLGYWSTHPAEWTPSVLTRIAALDSSFASVDPKAVFKATGQPASLKAQLLATYFNLATNRIGLNTTITGTLAASLGVTSVGSAASFGKATLALPSTPANKTRVSNATTLLEAINDNKVERY
ncbi:MAG TPA: hypothetical protein VL856_20205 [Acidimicrobiia bacterium]|nr:hypothetical protein [Acidimicrobiia bacterium]